MKNIYPVSIFICFVFLSNSSMGQQFEEYTWTPDRALTSLDKAEADLPLLYLKKTIQYQYLYEETEKEPVCYFTDHQIIRVNNDEALQRVNRIYIPTENMIELIDVKARTITPSGKVVLLDESNIREVKDEEEGGYQIFAIEGAEIGGEVEYFYTKKITARYFGREFAQLKYPMKDFSFTLTCPENLEFEFRSYNGLPQVTQSDTSKSFNRYTLHADYIEDLPEEAFSSFDGSRQRLDFKLSYNSASSKNRLFTWNDAASRIYNQIYSFDPAEMKDVKKLLKVVGVDKLATAKEKISKTEHYVKTNFYLNENAGSEAEDLSTILRQKFGNERGLTILFAALLTELGVSHEIVLTQSRSEVYFDKDFDTWSSLNDYVIYLPDLGSYLAPYAFELRLGNIPSNLTATNGLYIRPMKVRDFTYPVAEVRWIPEPDHTVEFDNLSIGVRIPDDLSAAIIEVQRSFGGVQASYLKSIYEFLEPEKKQDLLEEMIEFLAIDAEVENVSLDNKTFTYQNWNDPFVITANYKAPSYLELAGDIMLFKVGELIGPQSELYQDEKRITRVQNTNNRSYFRKIQIHLPPDFLIENADDIDMNVQVEEGARVIYAFKSTHQLHNALLSITIDEFYNEIYFPQERFEEFRKVVNAAADWNKVTLVMKRK
ncbi:MAG: DUF3857 domain-containing protein [Imperialibacter sp.]|uniref:DUF3857 domain-containing protein n=1 Tax=Imperialibacter sp. TaxID=2038411 RepID=UPI0032EE9E09